MIGRASFSSLLVFLFSNGYSLDYNRDLTPKECPVVASLKTKIFHTKGQTNYLKLLKSPNRKGRKCFKNKENALKAGFRPAKK